MLVTKHISQNILFPCFSTVLAIWYLTFWCGAPTFQDPVTSRWIKSSSAQHFFSRWTFLFHSEMCQITKVKRLQQEWEFTLFLMNEQRGQIELMNDRHSNSAKICRDLLWVLWTQILRGSSGNELHVYNSTTTTRMKSPQHKQKAHMWQLHQKYLFG